MGFQHHLTITSRLIIPENNSQNSRQYSTYYYRLLYGIQTLRRRGTQTRVWKGIIQAPPPAACAPWSLGAPLSWRLDVSTDWEALQTLCFWVFIEASLHMNHRLNHWPPGTDSISSPSPFPHGTKTSNSLSQGWFSWRPAPSLGVEQNHLIHMTHLSSEIPRVS